jgi:hypothetical protein
MHELEEVDDHQAQAPLHVKPAGLGPDLCHADHGRVINIDVSVGEDAHGPHDLPLLAVGVLAQAQTGGVNAGLHGDETLHQLLGRHLQAEDGHGGLLTDRGIASEVHDQGGLAQARPGDHHNKVRALEPAQEGIQIHEAGAGSGRTRNSSADGRLR